MLDWECDPVKLAPMTDAAAARTFDAILVLSFGGPEREEDVRPFLENVTRGRGIPPERLDEVGEHYHHFGGRSPLNELNREIIANLEKKLADESIDLPVYFGNRNWHPMVEDTVEQMSRDGVTRALVFATSAWAGYSGCRQYHEDIARAQEHLDAVAELNSIEMEKLRGFHDHPLFIGEFARAVEESRAKLPADRRDGARLVFTAHSIPNSADDASGPLAFPVEQTCEDGSTSWSEIAQAGEDPHDLDEPAPVLEFVGAPEAEAEADPAETSHSHSV